MSTLTPAALAEARRLAEEATPGPFWRRERFPFELRTTLCREDAAFIAHCNPAFVLELVREVERLLDVEADQKYQLERAAILSVAVGRARLALKNGESGDALAVLDAAADKTRSLLAATIANPAAEDITIDSGGLPGSVHIPSLHAEEGE